MSSFGCRTEFFNHLGAFIQPLEDGFGAGAVAQAVMELFADGVGKAGDFAVRSWVHDVKMSWN